MIMKAASKFIVVAATSLALGMPASAQDDLSAQGILAIGKMTGACGIMDSMIQFQKTTRMEGGEAFVLRLWEVEAARLGMSVQQLSEQCNKSVSAYDTLWSTAEALP